MSQQQSWTSDALSPAYKKVIRIFENKAIRCLQPLPCLIAYLANVFHCECATGVHSPLFPSKCFILFLVLESSLEQRPQIVTVR